MRILVHLGMLRVETLEIIYSRKTRLLPSCVWYENAFRTKGNSRYRM